LILVLVVGTLVAGCGGFQNGELKLGNVGWDENQGSLVLDEGAP
jgi:hypothetical protein